MKKFNVKNKNIEVYYPNVYCDKIPLILINSHSSIGSDIYNTCMDIGCNNFILVSINNIDWNNELSPWKFNKFNGGANDYLKLIENSIIPVVKEFVNSLNISISYYAIGGYSLAGLFSIYASINSKIFESVISCSGSLWYPGIIEYIKNNNTNASHIYFSLGNREAKTKNKILNKVEDNTKEIEEYYKEQGIDTIYIENPGGHFQDNILRVCRGIKWICK